MRTTTYAVYRWLDTLSSSPIAERLTAEAARELAEREAPAVIIGTDGWLDTGDDLYAPDQWDVDACGYLVTRSDDEVDPPAESDLTRRAREVLAGLSEAMRRDVMRAAGLVEGVALRTGNALRRRGLVDVYAGRRGLWKLTDFGREVARLLADTAGLAARSQRRRGWHRG